MIFLKTERIKRPLLNQKTKSWEMSRSKGWEEREAWKDWKQEEGEALAHCGNRVLWQRNQITISWIASYVVLMRNQIILWKFGQLWYISQFVCSVECFKLIVLSNRPNFMSRMRLLSILIILDGRRGHLLCSS